MTRWNPFREMVEMQRTMDRMLDEVNRVTGSNAADWAAVGNWLALDVQDTGENYVIQADVPGVNPDNIEITVHENTLTINGEVVQPAAPTGTRQIMNERRFGKFRRSITLPHTVDVDKANAAYDKGVLTLTLPRSEASKPRQIAVKQGNLLQHAN
jgi:HSP20 family protein